LIRPLGFQFDDRQLRRAGLDYHEWAAVRLHRDLPAFLAEVNPARLFAFTTKGARHYHEIAYQPDDVLLFGPETRGLPARNARLAGVDFGEHSSGTAVAAADVDRRAQLESVQRGGDHLV